MCPRNILSLYIILHFLVIRVRVMSLPAFNILDRSWKSVCIHEERFTDSPVKYMCFYLFTFFRLPSMFALQFLYLDCFPMMFLELCSFFLHNVASYLELAQFSTLYCLFLIYSLVISPEFKNVIYSIVSLVGAFVTISENFLLPQSSIWDHGCLHTWGV